MPALWDTKVTFVCFSVLGVSIVLPLSICLWTLCNSASYHLTWKKKKGGLKEELNRKEKKILISLLLILNLFSEFCWSS